MKQFLIFCCCVLFSACGASEPSHEIRFAIAQSPLNLDPRYATDAASERVNRLLYESLVDFDGASRPMPRLAAWRVVSPTVYQCTLNPSRAHFHNQMPLTAGDVKATYDSLRELKDSPHAAEFANIRTIEVLDENTVVFYLWQADVHFPAKLIMGILPQKLIEAKHDFSHHPVGSGALQLISWNNQLRLQRVRDGQVISLQEVKDPTVRVLKLLRGEADVLQGDLPAELVAYLQKQPEVSVSTGVGANFSYLGLNLQDPILKHIKVRQALAHAIDRKAIVRQVMIPHSREAGAILPPEHYAGNRQLSAYEYDPQRARQLLTEAGVQLPLKLVYKTSTDAQRLRFATILQAQMRPAGIALEIRSLDWGTFFSDVKQGQFQLFGLTWVGIKTPEIYTKVFHSQQMPPQGFNRGRYVDRTLDALLQQEDWQAITAQIHRQLPYIPLWYEGQFVALGQDIRHYSPKSDGNWDDLQLIERQGVRSK